MDEMGEDDSFKLVIANEFFDSLPTLLFSRDSPGSPWLEVLVDGVDVGYDAKFRFTRASSATANSTFFRTDQASGDNGVDAFLEICPEARRISLLVAAMMARSGGLFCAVDYGDMSCLRKTPSLRVRTPPSVPI